MDVRVIMKTHLEYYEMKRWKQELKHILKKCTDTIKIVLHDGDGKRDRKQNKTRNGGLC